MSSLVIPTDSSDYIENLKTTSALAGFYKPTRYQKTSQIFQNNIGNQMRKYPYITYGVLLGTLGAVYVASGAMAVSTGVDPLFLLAAGFALAGALFLTLNGMNRFAKHVLKDKYPDSIYKNVNTVCGLGDSASFIAASGCYISSTTAALLYPAVGFCMVSLIFAGFVLNVRFPNLGRDIKARIGYNPLKVFEKHSDLAISFSGVLAIFSGSIMKAVEPGAFISPFSMAGGAGIVGLGLGISILLAPQRAKNSISQKVSAINDKLKQSGKDLTQLVKIQDGKFQAKDENLQESKEIADSLNKIYGQIYIYKNEKSFEKLIKYMDGTDGIKAAQELLNCKDIILPAEPMAAKKSEGTNRRRSCRKI